MKQRKILFSPMRNFALFAILLISSCSKRETGTLTWWQFWTDPQTKPLVAELVVKFEKENPGAKVEVTDLTWADGHEKITVAFSAGQPPDVLELGSDWIYEYASNKLLLNLTSKTDSLKKDLVFWQPALLGEKTFAVPWILGTRVMFYNLNLLKKAGLDDVPAAWNQLAQLNQKMAKFKPKTYGFGANASERHRLYKKFLPFFWSAGARIFSADGKICLLNSPEGVKALEYYADLCQDALLATQANLDDAFLQGKVAGVISGDWLLKKLKNAPPKFDYTTDLMPSSDGKLPNRTSFAGGEFLAVPAKSKKRELAWRFVQFLVRPDNQVYFCRNAVIPTPSSVAAQADTFFLSDPNYRTFIEQLQLAQSPPPHPHWVEIEQAIEEAVEQAMYKKKTPKAALDEAANKINALLRT
ncbi:MAG: extracellular solute-binding protein [candidate division Zixibacteria bacterium]|nr:extracellular solute-binding protein [candidate division Zixibacteria bacterium]